ncbi:MAG: glycosyl hydrolase, partial [Pseudobutyrivibrio sp.]|nr:glycosyl hydrolase [Pseudobutyrivibrio sp.]
MVDLKKKPFYLDDEQIEWVENTIKDMTLEEKMGQLLVILKAVPGVNEEAIKGSLDSFHQGGLRWQGGDKDTVYLQNTTYQKYSKIPLFVAANCDEGGNGCLPEGTFVATAAEAGASDGFDTAYHMGLVAGREATAIGCNWMFNPIADIYMNWRNTIVNTRSFGDDVDKVIGNARAYIKGIKDANPNMACTAKHFPGDGVEELDQHLVLGVNTLSAKEWEDSFGKVYQTLIDDGLETIMVGHIAQPELSRKLRPGIKDDEIMPATLAPELLTDL